ncbi:MAG: nucleoside 2-deoxyribosyltransferase [Candidatus Sungbacteria bacterium]|nr:nucleoside 2-deoxyribosyltransferase [Candidatus Sungbacteria bacterium]
MNIFISHSREFEYRTELYEPIKKSDLFSLHTFIFPHENNSFRSTKDEIRTCDVVIAEVSFPSTGVGIELGWANSFGKPTICLHKKDSHPSSSLKAVSAEFIMYDNASDMVKKLSEALANSNI